MNPRLWQWISDALSGIGAAIVVTSILWVTGVIDFGVTDVAKDPLQWEEY